MITTCIVSRWKNKKLVNLIKNLKEQSIKTNIKVYTDEFFEFDGVEIIHCKWKNVAEKRNLTIFETNSEYLFLVDDDNEIKDKDFLKKMLETYKKIEKKHWESIISVLMMWRNTDIIQSAGLKFCYLLWKVFANKKIKWEYWKVEGIWTNTLFGKTKYFQKAKFDKEIWFIREDIDYTYSLKENWVNLFVINQRINHQEKDKDELEKSYIKWNLFYKKLKNRNLFVKKHWNILQKLMYWSIWYWLWIIVWKYKRWKNYFLK